MQYVVRNTGTCIQAMYGLQHTLHINVLCLKRKSTIHSKLQVIFAGSGKHCTSPVGVRHQFCQQGLHLAAWKADLVGQSDVKLVEAVRLVSSAPQCSLQAPAPAVAHADCLVL